MSPYKRRALLTSAALAAAGSLAGCTDVAVLGQGRDPDANRTPLPDRVVEFPDGPEDRPERPETLTETSVGEFVLEHEYRYVYNELWLGEGTGVELSCRVEDVAQIDVGFRAVVETSGRSSDGDGNSATWPEQRVTYLLDEDSLIRRPEAEDGRSE